MADFKRLIALAHDRGLAVVSFDNLGYPAWTRWISSRRPTTCARAGSRAKPRSSSGVIATTRRRRAASLGNSFFMVRPTHLPGSKPGTLYESSKHEFWAKSDRAGRYYWTKWAGVDKAGRRARLPQYNWGSQELQAEMEKVVRFWMDTGIDGMIIDAVNW